MALEGISQCELSERTGITQPSISDYMNGKKLPSFYTVDKIAKALGCSVDAFRYFVR
jgi:transcriptional regulator with XRE-family HTH domain